MLTPLDARERIGADLQFARQLLLGQAALAATSEQTPPDPHRQGVASRQRFGAFASVSHRKNICPLSDESHDPSLN